jgi:hypothetical protein
MELAFIGDLHWPSIREEIMTAAAAALDNARKWLGEPTTNFRRLNFEIWQFGTDTVLATGRLHLLGEVPGLLGFADHFYAGASALGGGSAVPQPTSAAIFFNPDASGAMTGDGAVTIHRATGSDTHAVSWSYDGTYFDATSVDRTEFVLILTRIDVDFSTLRAISRAVLES